MNHTILITGGLGFVGTNIVDYLVRRTTFAVKVFDRPLSKSALRTHPVMQHGSRVSFFPGDLLDIKSITRAMKGVSYVIHLAAKTHAGQSVTNPLPVIETNVMGTAHMLEAARREKVARFILFSSSEVYGNTKNGTTMNERQLLRPVTPYAASKVAGDRLGFSYATSMGLPVVIVRPFNMYGPWQPTVKMIPIFITKLFLGKHVELNNEGKPKRDFIYIDDVSAAVLALIRAPVQKVVGQEFNIGTGKAVAIRDVARMISTILKKDKRMLTLLNNHLPETMANVGISEKMSAVVGWKSKTSLAEGLKKTVHWYLAHRDWWVDP